jgi:mRNA interferase MazF
MNYRRGDVVTCAPPGEYGKPRPAVVMQSDLFNPTHASVTLCPLTSHLIEAGLFRIPLEPTPDNGLKVPSQAMTDKLTTLRSERVGAVVGHLADADVTRIEEAVMRWLGLKT